jgi:two-component system, response regulator PdtaR
MRDIEQRCGEPGMNSSRSQSNRTCGEFSINCFAVAFGMGQHHTEGPMSIHLECFAALAHARGGTFTHRWGLGVSAVEGFTMGVRAGQADPGSKPATILVVEDDALARISVAEHLRGLGYHVVEAGTADEALSALSTGLRVHLVFSDVELPGTMGGFSFAIWIRNHYRSIPVVLTSGVKSVMLPLNRQHLVPFLSKPYRPEEAAELIATTLAVAAG